MEGWGRLRILATEEMSRRVQEAFREPTEEEMRARFEKSRATRVQPARFRVSALRFGWEDQPLPARYRRAEEALARVRAGGLSFERAARELSTHASSSRGGDLGWLTARELAVLGPSVLATIKELEVGAVGPVVATGRRALGSQLTGREEERPQTFEEARLALERELGNEQTQAIQKRIEDHCSRTSTCGDVLARKNHGGRVDRRALPPVRDFLHRELLDLEVHQLHGRQDVAGGAEHGVLARQRNDAGGGGCR